MSKKRSQRKNSNYNYRPGQKAGEDPQALQENSRTKKFSPAARNLLFVDLIFLAVCQMMESGGLLDDVLSELDQRRQDFVLGRITGGQVFITGCQPPETGTFPGNSLHIVQGTLADAGAADDLA